MVKVLCSSCRQRYTVENSLLGKKAKCSVCGECFVPEAAVICPVCGEYNFSAAAECRGCHVPFLQPGCFAPQSGTELYESYGFRNFNRRPAREEITMLTALRRYYDFSGRASRKEFWLFSLFMLIVRAGIFLFVGIGSMHLYSGSMELAATLSTVVSFALLLPATAVAVRRLHDTGRNGWYLLLSFVPLIGGILLLAWFCEDSHRGANIYGENPKNEN